MRGGVRVLCVALALVEGEGALRSVSLVRLLGWKRRHDSRCRARRCWRLVSGSLGLGWEDGVREEVVTARRCECREPGRLPGGAERRVLREVERRCCEVVEEGDGGEAVRFRFGVRCLADAGEGVAADTSSRVGAVESSTVSI